MTNENELLGQSLEFNLSDLEQLNTYLDELDLENLQEIETIKTQQSVLENREEFGTIVLNSVWNQFLSQVSKQCGVDFLEENNGLTLDLSKDAHIQSTENFNEGNIANHNTHIDYQKRYDNWIDSFQRDESGNFIERADHITGESKKVLKKEARAIFDKDRPKGSKTVNKDHVVSAAEILRDPAIQAHLDIEEQVSFANSEVNLADLDAAANMSKKDSKMTDWLDYERDGKKPAERFNIDEEELRERDQSARAKLAEELSEGEKRSISTGKQSRKEETIRISKQVGKAIVIKLLVELARQIIAKLIIWLKEKQKSFQSFLESVKEAVASFAWNLLKIVADTTSVAVGVHSKCTSQTHSENCK